MTAGQRWRLRLTTAYAAALLVVLVAWAALAQPSASAQRPLSASASASAAPAVSASATASPVRPSEPPDPRVAELRELATQVNDLVSGDLDADVDPKSLFPIDPADNKTVRVQRARLTLLLAAVDDAAAQAAAISSAAAADAGADSPPDDAATAEQDSGSDAGVDAAELVLADDLAKLVPPSDVPLAVWEARLDLDRARLAFYELSETERARVLEEHLQKSVATPDAKADEEVDEAERKALEAEADQQRALEVAARSRTEAQRAVAEEQARLLGVTKLQAELEARMARSRGELLSRAEPVLAWQRRVRDLRSAVEVDAAEVDRTYDELRQALRTARTRLAAALDTLGTTTAVPAAGNDRLAELPADIDTSAAREVRGRVDANATALTKQESALRLDIASAAYDEVVALNRERLQLYKLLSSDKRDAITGFGADGVDQARAELWQVTLVVRYHVRATSRWVASFRAGDNRGQSAVTATLLGLRWLLPIAAFIAWRRRAPALLVRAREGARERSQAGTLGTPPLVRLVNFVARVRVPLEWLLVTQAALWLLPGEMRSLWELRLVETALLWTIGGQLVVAAVDATFGDQGGIRKSRLQTAHLRLRSLRLIGRVVVLVGLVLALTNQLVGTGTIYDWVWSTSWLGLIPLTGVLARWWKEVVFAKIELRRRKTAFDTYLLARKDGWRGLLAGLIGGAMLLGTSAFRSARVWVTQFELTRRALAYLFLREMSKRSEEQEAFKLAPLPDALFEKLGPGNSSPKDVASVADTQLESVIKRIQAAGGGVFAVVGERGAGKSKILRRVQQQLKDVTYVECPFDGLPAFATSLAAALGKPGTSSLAELGRDLEALSAVDDSESALLIDDAHRLIQPRMDGLRAFDELLAVARMNSHHNAWVFAFDEVIWRFFERARGARPLFDEVITLAPWSEDTIARLLMTRSSENKVSPSFERLLDELPKDADEIDLQEAAERAATGYYRLLWNYADGNPGVALHMWRRSLGVAEDEGIAVRAFSAPSTYELDVLPDNSVFILRAVLHLERALPADLEKATMLPASEVHDLLRYGLAHGYLREIEGRYQITWDWFRPITSLLKRRHLLF